MNNTDYLQKILSLCTTEQKTTEQKEFIKWLYPNKLIEEKVDIVIKHVEIILKNDDYYNQEVKPMTYIEQFKLLKTDHDKWKWLIDNSNIDHGLTVMLDNDETFVVDNSTGNTVCTFSDYIGNGYGIGVLLESLGIPFESV